MTKTIAQKARLNKARNSLLKKRPVGRNRNIVMKRGLPSGRGNNRMNNNRRARNGIVSRPLPSNFNYSVTNRKPTFKNRGANVIIRHREFVMGVSPGVVAGWKVSNVLALNPGNFISFPWLSRIAGNYENYKINGFTVHYVPNCSTGTAGALGLVIDYDSADTGIADESAFLNSAHAISFSPYTSKVLFSSSEELNKGLKTKFVSDGTTNVGQDIKTLDFGKLYVSASGTTIATRLGNIFFEYNIELLTPTVRFSDTNMVGFSGGLSTLRSNAKPVMGTNSETATYFGNNSNIRYIVDNSIAFDRFSFIRPGNYICEFYGRWTSISGSLNMNTVGAATSINVSSASTSTRHYKKILLYTNPDPTGTYLDINISSGFDPIDSFVLIRRITDDEYDNIYNWSFNTVGYFLNPFAGYPLLEGFQEDKTDNFDKDKNCVNILDTSSNPIVADSICCEELPDSSDESYYEWMIHNRTKIENYLRDEL